jgi:hypothetical protein
MTSFGKTSGSGDTKHFPANDGVAIPQREYLPVRPCSLTDLLTCTAIAEGESRFNEPWAVRHNEDVWKVPGGMYELFPVESRKARYTVSAGRFAKYFARRRLRFLGRTGDVCPK